MHKRDLSPGERLKRGALFALLFTACGLIACGDDEPPAVEFPRIPREIIGPEARPARLFVPLSYTPSRAYPLVLMLHGYQVNGDAQDLVLGLRERVESMGFALLIPEGTPDLKGKQFWNAWEECCNFDGLGVDDVGYLSALVEEAAREIHVDAERVSIVGHSNAPSWHFVSPAIGPISFVVWPPSRAPCRSTLPNAKLASPSRSSIFMGRSTSSSRTTTTAEEFRAKATGL